MTARNRRAEHEELRDLQRRAKEELKLSVLEQARLEVATHEKLLTVLLSVHKEESEPRDWKSLAAPLRPVRPERHSHHELRARREAVLCEAGVVNQSSAQIGERIESGRSDDEREYRNALLQYETQVAECERQKGLAVRVLARDLDAYREVLRQTDPLAEIADLCVSADYIVHATSLIECALSVKGTDIIPQDSKTLTSTGKVSTRAMPKGRVHEIYQDYVCGSVIRVARELFDSLPIDKVLVQAFVDTAPVGAQIPQQPVLSVLIPRSELDAVDCETADPSDAMDRFLHRGDVKASRKTGEFARIQPLGPTDVPEQPMLNSLAQMLTHIRAVRLSLKHERDSLTAALEKSPGN